MLAPPVLVVWEEALEGLRFSGVFSPPLLAGGVNAEAGHANASRQKPSTATTCAAARKSGIDLVIKDDSEEESPTVIGPDVEVLRDFPAYRCAAKYRRSARGGDPAGNYS
jgi:hypothetical protein